MDGWSTDVEDGVGSDEEHSLMDSLVSSAVVQGGGCVVQCSMQNEMVGGMCNDWAPRAWKEISSHPDLGSAYVLAPQSLGHGFIKSFLGSQS